MKRGLSEALPRPIQLQLATLTDKAPQGDQWFHEIKLDGYRMACRITPGRVEFISRNQRSWTGQLKWVAADIKALGLKQALLDGEIVAMKPDGTSDFQVLQNAFRDGRAKDLLYYVFDLLHYDGADLRPFPLDERKRILADVFASLPAPGPLRFSEHIVGHGPAFHKQACKAGLEGIISKRRDRPYTAGRGYDWLKVKCHQTGEFVVGGFTPPEGSREGFGALLLGYYDDEGKLIYAGRVGTGFSRQTLVELLARLEPLRQDRSPFAKRKGGPPRKSHWVKPELVAQIRFTHWTDDGSLRHPSFQGLREDKPAAAIGREKAVPVRKAAGRSRGRQP